MGEKLKWADEGIKLVLTSPKRRYLAFSVAVPLPVFRRQAGGSGSSNNSLTRQRRRAKPAAIAGVLDR